MNYSLFKGFVKSFWKVALVTLGVVGTLTFTNIPIWDLMVTYVKPIIGSLTVSGALLMAQNYIKVRYLRD